MDHIVWAQFSLTREGQRQHVSFCVFCICPRSAMSCEPDRCVTPYSLMFKRSLIYVLQSVWQEQELRISSG